MSNEIMKKLEEHDKRFDEHDELFVKIDKRFDQVDGQIDFLVHKVLAHDKQFDFLIKKSLEHDDQFRDIKENMVTKDDIKHTNEALDKIVSLYQKKDQELTFMNPRISRLEEQTNQNTKDIQQIKPALGLS